MTTLRSSCETSCCAHLHVVVAVEGDGRQARLAAQAAQHDRILVLRHVCDLHLRACVTVMVLKRGHCGNDAHPPD